MENIVFQLLKNNGINDLLPVFVDGSKTGYWCYSNNEVFYFCNSEGTLISRSDLNLDEGILALLKKGDGYYIIPAGEKSEESLMFLNRENKRFEKDRHYSYYKLSSMYYVLGISEPILGIDFNRGEIVDINGDYLKSIYCGNLSKNRIFLSKYNKTYFDLCDENLNVLKRIEAEKVFSIHDRIITVENDSICLYNEDGILQASKNVDFIDFSYNKTYYTENAVLIPNGLILYYITYRGINTIDIENQCYRFNCGIKQITAAKMYSDNIIECEWDNGYDREYYEDGYLYIDIYANIVYAVLNRLKEYNSYYIIYVKSIDLNNPISGELEIKRGIVQENIEKGFDVILPPIYDKIIDLNRANIYSNDLEIIAFCDDTIKEIKHWKYYKQERCLLDIKFEYWDSCYTYGLDVSNECHQIKRISDEYVKYMVDEKEGVLFNGKVLLEPKYDKIICIGVPSIVLARNGNEWMIIKSDTGDILLTEYDDSDSKSKSNIKFYRCWKGLYVYFREFENFYFIPNSAEDLKPIYSSGESFLIDYRDGYFMFRIIDNNEWVLVNWEGEVELDVNEKGIININSSLYFDTNEEKFFYTDDDDEHQEDYYDDYDYRKESEDFLRSMNEDFPGWGWNID